MSVNSLVAIPELQAEGPARLESKRQGWCSVRFLASGAEMTVEQHSVMRYVLLPGTRVDLAGSGGRRQGLIEAVLPQNSAAALLRYQVRLGEEQQEIDEAAIARVHLPQDPGEQLSQVAFHDLMVGTNRSGKARPPVPWGPQTLCAREAVLAWSDQLWHAAGGVLGLPGARIDLLPHQIATARRALSDRTVRYLLADEVGLGKTIEAGLIMQSLLAMNPHLRVLVVAPGALVGQWFLELFVKFGGRRFTMLDGARLAEAKDPWGEQFAICSARALEDLGPREALRFATASWDVVVMDECHRMQPGGILYQRMAVLSKKTPHVLLLSATPPRQHADAYLALLHVLQPDAYPLDQPEAFRAKLERADEVAQVIRACEQDAASALALAQQYLGDDSHLQQLLSADSRSAAVTWMREHYVPDHRVIRHRRRTLARLAEHSQVPPLALGTRTRWWCDYHSDAAEKAVRQAVNQYRQALLGAERAGSPETLPPRLAHWILQVDLALGAQPQQLERLLAMRSAVVEDPEDFAEYRQRAPKNESLAAVLRADLSESELSTQIAISASSHVHPEIERPLLARCQEALAAWGKQQPGRVRALLRALREFWREHPQEKVLLFTNHALSLQAVRDYLIAKLGPQRVADFGAHQDAEEREAAAAHFRQHDDCWVLVCDALGGEGRNFQFVSLVAHYDLPWSIPAIEQRIGRVDRLGRDGEVISLVCRCRDEDAIDGAWAEVVDQAVDIFQQSSSGLEFIAAAVEEQALAATLSPADGSSSQEAAGATGLRQLLPQLCAQVQQERELLQADEDDAFAHEAAEFVAAQDIAAQLQAINTPVAALCRWLRGMGGQVRSEEGPQAQFSLRERSSSDWIDGVFSAAAARRQPQLAFFARGHQLIDRLVDDAATATWCQASAWRRPRQEDTPPWEGLRISLRLHLALEHVLQAGASLETLRRVWNVLPVPPQWLFMAIDGSIEQRPEIIAQLRPGFDQRQGDQALSQRVSRALWMQPLVSGKGAAIATWQQRVRQAYSAAAEQAAEQAATYRGPAMAALEVMLESQQALLEGRFHAAQRRLPPTHPDILRLQEEVAAESKQAELLRASLHGARLEISSVCYITLV